MKFVIMSFLALLLCSCSTTEKKKLNAKVEQETETLDGARLTESVHHLIAESKSLTPEQKTKILGLIDDVRAKNKALTEQTFKYRGVLMKELLAGEAGKTQIKIVEKQISKIERERLKNTIEAAQQISTVVRDHKEEKKILDQFMIREIDHRI